MKKVINDLVLTSVLILSNSAFASPSQNYRPLHGGYPGCIRSSEEALSGLNRSQLSEIPIMVRSIEARLSGNSASGAMDPNLKSIKRDFDEIYSSLNQAIYKEMATSTDPKKHCPRLVSVVENFLKQLEEQHARDPRKVEVIKYLKSEFTQKRDRELNLIYVLGLPARFLAATSEPSETEKEVYAHVLNLNSFGQLIAKDAWKDADTFFATLNNNVRPLPVPSASSSPKVPFPIPTDLPFVSHLDIRFPLIQGKNFLSPVSLSAQFIQNHYPLVMPTVSSDKTKIQAHGIGVAEGEPGLSEFGHFFHDVFHAKWALLSTENAIKEAFEIQLAAQYEKHQREKEKNPHQGFDVELEVKKALPLVQQKHKRLMHLEKALLDAFVEGDLGTHQGTEHREAPNFQAAVAGFFLGIHEFPVISADLIHQDSPTRIIELFCDRLKAAIHDRGSWESSSDPLQTSPLDGRSAMTDEAISKASLHNPGSSLKEIKRSKLFIDITLMHTPTTAQLFSHSTLFHRLNNSEDAFKLMKYAGEAKPDGELARLRAKAFGDRSNRDATIQYLDALRDAMDRCVDAFKTAAIKEINKRNSSGHSIEEAYRSWAPNGNEESR